MKGLWHCIWSWGCSQQVPAARGQVPIYCWWNICKTYLSRPKRAWNSAGVWINANGRIKIVFLHVSDSKKIFLSCRHPTKIPSPHRVPPTIKWDQDGGARAGKIDDGFFQTPPQPAFKGHWWYLFDTISFWHCSEAKTSKCGVGGRKKQHATCNFFETLTKAFHYFFFYVVWFVFDINEIIVLTVLIVYWSSLSLIGAASYVPILQARCPSSTIESVALSCHSLISNACLHNTPEHVCMCS